MPIADYFHDAKSFNAAERERSQRPVRDRLSEREEPARGDEKGNADSASPVHEPSVGAVGPLSVSDRRADSGRDGLGIPDRSLEETIRLGVKYWRLNRSFGLGDPLSDSDAEGVVRYVHHMLHAALRNHTLDTVETLTRELDAALSERAWLAARIDHTQAEILTELRHAYNTIARLVADRGGRVSINSDEVYGEMDIALLIDEDEEGNISLRTQPVVGREHMARGLQ